MNQDELVFNIVHSAKAAVNYGLPIIQPRKRGFLEGIF